MSRCRRFVELCCGAASVSLRLHSDSARPFVGYQGGKRRLARPILNVFGLGCGHGADSFWWVDAGEWGRVWPVLMSERRAVVVGLLRSWQDEEAQALWERLRDEPVPEDAAERAAVWVALQQGNAQGRDVHEVAGRWQTHGYAHLSELAREKGFLARLHPDCLADKIEALPAPPVVASHEQVTPALSDSIGGGDCVLFDPPYRETSGYSNDLGRDTVEATALACADRGARVVVCEAEPLRLPGWHHVDLTPFGGGKPEWVACSFPPAWTPAV